MFDAETDSLIRNAPSLEGLDLTALPKDFTRIFASIVAARMRLRRMDSQKKTEETATKDPSTEVRQAVQAEISFLLNLANTQEALISVSPNRTDRKSAAFVAGTAHYVLLQARRLIADTNVSIHLGINSIPPEVSATLLFLIAGASADASQMSREINGLLKTGNGIRERLLHDIGLFASGQLTKIGSPAEYATDLCDEPPAERACSVLYHLIHANLYKFAQVMLGQLDQSKRRLITVFP